MKVNTSIVLALYSVSVSSNSISCGSIGFNAGNITKSDGRMKVRLMILPNEPKGVAWPASARGVKCLKLTH